MRLYEVAGHGPAWLRCLDGDHAEGSAVGSDLANFATRQAIEAHRNGMNKEDAAARGLKIAFTFDSLAGQWPYVVTRDLCVDPEARLDSLLASHFPEVDVDGLDPMFSSAALAHLVHLVINAILYATSAGVEPQPRRPSGKKARGATKGLPDRLPRCADEVFYLPGKIDITSVRNMQAVERAPSGGKLLHRFMVRGHWRRAAPTWEDQRPRWIRPYWKGPDMATLIERAYRLKA